MGFHHVAIATRDLQATHRFYSEAMGFELAKVVAGKSPEGGWAKHAFYRTPGGDLIAFWDLHDAGLPEDWSPAIPSAAPPARKDSRPAPRFHRRTRTARSDPR